MRNLRHILSARLFVLAALAAGGCQPAEREKAGNEITDEVSPLPSLPVAEPPIDRAGLLMASTRAASAAALGQDDADEQHRLDGKRFEVRIRFGCATSVQPSNAAASFDVRFDEQDRMLRVRAAPDLTIENSLVAALAGQAVEAVEGFWIRRPWLLADGCPVGPAPQPRKLEAQEAPAVKNPPEVPSVNSYRIGVAQFYTEADSRTGRRNARAYEATKRLRDDERPSPEGFNLVLSGRLRPLMTGRVISCRVTSPDLAPDCVISAKFDRVRIETPSTRRVLAEWAL